MFIPSYIVTQHQCCLSALHRTTLLPNMTVIPNVNLHFYTTCLSILYIKHSYIYLWLLWWFRLHNVLCCTVCCLTHYKISFQYQYCHIPEHDCHTKYEFKLLYGVSCSFVNSAFIDSFLLFLLWFRYDKLL